MLTCFVNYSLTFLKMLEKGTKKSPNGDFLYLATPTGLEPVIFSVTGKYVNQLHHGAS